MMPVSSYAKLFTAVLHLTLLLVIHGSSSDDLATGNGRRWSPGGGHYRLVVSSLHHDDTELKPEESVGYPYIHKDKPSKGSSIEDFDSDKVTQRIVNKSNRKRTRLLTSTDAAHALTSTAVRKRRRHPVAASSTVQVTTGPPRTMSYNLYNHFRPIEQDVPQDVLLPFLDFGKKLSTPSGFNSIEGSSTPRDSPVSSSTDRNRNTPNGDESDEVYHEDMDVAVTMKAIERNIAPRKPVQLRQPTFFSRPPSVVDSPVGNNNADSSNKTDINSTVDLQSNESGVKIHAVLSPNYGLKLNRTVPDASNVTISPEKYSSEAPALNQTEATVDVAAVNPNPTSRILSTAVVTSVSVKESQRVPRVKPNSSSESSNENESKKNETIVVKPIDQRNDTLLLTIARRKLFTTLRPKTTTLRPVVLRSNYRKNSSVDVLHVISTPPTYIEVPKISPSLVRTTRPPDVSSTVEAPVSRTVVETVESTFLSKQMERLNNASEVTARAALASDNSAVTVSEPTPSSSTSSVAPTTLRILNSEPETTKTVEVTDPSSSPIPTTVTEALEEVETTAFTENFNDSPPSPALEIEFKPLAENMPVDTTDIPSSTPPTTTITTPSTTTTFSTTTTTTSTSAPTTNFSVPLVPDLFWVYGQQRNNGVPVRTQSSSVEVTLQGSSLGVVTYILAALGVIPLVLGAFLGARQILLKGKTKVLDESEYSSEYNRSPLPTKLPRLPAHLNWEETKPEPPPIVLTTKWEFPREKLRLQTVLGQGNFGQVWKAEADDISGHEGLTRLVAVKTVKEGASVREKEDLLRELGIMQELGAHPNVVTLLGCCTEKEPYFLIMEYVMYGKMLAFLREHRTRAHYFNFSDLSSALTSRDLTVFAYCVARGMEYISSKGIVHRDLAARNVLVDHNKLCKIADFGMSRNVRDTGEIYEQRPNNRGALPIRWMAPESLHYNIFTQKTDVWSFGILLWEIITLGSTPYSTMGAREVMRQVGDGFRLERPKHCRSEFFRVATKCWSTDPGKRPTFSELKQEIGALLGTTESEGGYVDLEALAEEMCDQQMH